MPDLFGVDIAGELNAAMGSDLLDGTLHVVSSGTRTPGSLTGGTNPSEADHAFKGFLETKSDMVRGNTLVTKGGQFAVILGGSLPSGVEPKANHYLTIEGTKYRIVEITDRDPAAATYTCRLEV